MQLKSEEATKQEQRRQQQRQLVCIPSNMLYIEKFLQQAHQTSRDQLQAEIAGFRATEDQLTKAVAEEKRLVQTAFIQRSN